MQLFISMLLSSLVQIIGFTFIPFVWWFITARNAGFLSWIGLRKTPTENKDQLIKYTGITLVAFMVFSLLLHRSLQGVETATADFAGLGFWALPAAIVFGFLHTALPEEILFRGFLLKRLGKWLGFSVANMVQASIFGLIHGIMFVSLVGAFQAFGIILFTGAIGWFMGFINQQKAGGSIVPSWIIHGFANVFSAVIAMFSLV